MANRWFQENKKKGDDIFTNNSLNNLEKESEESFCFPVGKFFSTKLIALQEANHSTGNQFHFLNNRLLPLKKSVRSSEIQPITSKLISISLESQSTWISFELILSFFRGFIMVDYNSHMLFFYMPIFEIITISYILLLWLLLLALFGCDLKSISSFVLILEGFEKSKTIV